MVVVMVALTAAWAGWAQGKYGQVRIYSNDELGHMEGDAGGLTGPTLPSLVQYLEKKREKKKTRPPSSQF